MKSRRHEVWCAVLIELPWGSFAIPDHEPGDIMASGGVPLCLAVQMFAL